MRISAQSYTIFLNKRLTKWNYCLFYLGKYAVIFPLHLIRAYALEISNEYWISSNAILRVAKDLCDSTSLERYPELVLWFSTLCLRVYKSIPVLVLCLRPLCLRVYKSIPVLVLCLYPLCLRVYKSIPVLVLCLAHSVFGYIKVYPQWGNFTLVIARRA